MTPSAPRRMGHFSALPRVNLPNIRVPEMMDISSYIPTIKPPAFLKDVYSFPIQVGDHVNREVRSIGNNINKVRLMQRINRGSKGEIENICFCNLDHRPGRCFSAETPTFARIYKLEHFRCTIFHFRVLF